MANQSLTGVARLRAALRNSLQGAGDIWRGEEAFRLEVSAFIIALPLSLWVGTTAFQSAVLVGAILLVIIVEIVNSAIEAVVDRIGPERHELSRIAKDLGSLAVLVAVVLAGLLWGAALWDRFAG